MKALAGILALWWFTNAASAEVFQYIYIEANEGNSSGGHVALQFDNAVFHYQYDNGLIRLRQQDAGDFRFDYQYRQNRTLHVADVTVSAQTYRLLEGHFKQVFFGQQRQFGRLDALQQDGALLAWLAQAKSTASPTVTAMPDASLRIPGAGLFFNDGDFFPIEKPQGSCHSPATVLPLLRGRLAQRYGEDFLTRRAMELARAICGLPLGADGMPVAGSDYSFSERYRDLLTGLLALRTVREGRALAVDACHSLDGPEGRLGAQQRQALHAFQGRLWQSALDLAVSQRPDWAYAWFVTMARLLAVEQTLQTGRWVFLDDFAPDSGRIPAEAFARFPAAMAAQRQAAEANWRAALRGQGGIDERQYARLEMAANRYHEWLSSDGSHPPRYQGETALPGKAIRLPPLALPDWSAPQINQALQRQSKLAAVLARQIDNHYAYSLLARNCVTEIFHAINEALGDETGLRLGGVINADWNMIPFVAFETVRHTYPVTHVAVLPAYRQQLLARAYAHEFGPLAYARESNTLSATLYTYNPDDTPFIFFTDDALLLRPLFGTVNTVAGIGQGLYGMLLLPFDNGEQLTAATRGILMSLPELAFVNIRKGSYKYLPQPAW